MSHDTWRVFTTADGTAHPDFVEATARPTESEEAISGYYPPEDLAAAVDIAIALGQPLLLTGDPGTGKTQLAHYVAYRLFGKEAKPIVFNTKTTSTARDLFYAFDALAHFRDSQLAAMSTRKSRQIDAEDYITYQGLGLAILIASSRKDVSRYLPEGWRNTPRQQSVVLIDEIDKAPRDLPNDILNEIEQMSFEVRETGERFVAPPEFRPIVILTSNSERALPDPFLRRCVYHHLEYPGPKELTLIIGRRLGLNVDEVDSKTAWVSGAVTQFSEIRDSLNRKPATAELLSWLRLLLRIQEETGVSDPRTHSSAKSAFSVIAKGREAFSKLRG